MLGKVHEKYEELRKKKSLEEWKEIPAPFGRWRGVPIQSYEDKLKMEEEEQFQTAQDLGYE